MRESIIISGGVKTIKIKPSPHDIIREAYGFICKSRAKIKKLELPENHEIDAMSELAGKLHAMGNSIIAGRVDLALFKWLELDLNA